ncbi:MAG: GGDEF domain-containing protein, partial [Rubrivivax sp.]|nr:GGDEF domain-containing protein [Rubrivivax sp.]
ELNRELATRDGLTGLLNRRAAHEVLAREHPRVARGQGSLGLALLDIDHFKRINDGHGHDVGDQVLQRFALTLGRQLRPGDALVRWGGEEFLLLMPGTGPADAQRTLARLRASLSDAGFEALLGGAGVTFSAGLVQCMAHESHEAAMARADRALYRAKAGGRDRVECDPADGPGRADLTGESRSDALHAAPSPAEAR